MASPDQFIPALPGWRERSLLIARHGHVEFFHYDFYSQALAKLQRAHDRDLRDAHALVTRGFVQPRDLAARFRDIEPQLVRHPAIDPASFCSAVVDFCMREGPPACPASHSCGKDWTTSPLAARLFPRASS